MDLVSPFLSLINSLNMTSPYKLIAMDAIQLFLECNVLINGGSKSSEALASIVHSVTTYVLVDLSFSCQFIFLADANMSRRSRLMTT